MTTRNDARLWACMIEPLRAAGVTDPETVARSLVAVVRTEDPATPGGKTYGPGDEIPYGVAAVYDLDGDVWHRLADAPASTQRDAWRMRDYESGEHDSAAGGVYLTPHLLTAYGPLTETTTWPSI